MLEAISVDHALVLIGLLFTGLSTMGGAIIAGFLYVIRTQRSGDARLHERIEVNGSATRDAIDAIRRDYTRQTDFDKHAEQVHAQLSALDKSIKDTTAQLSRRLDVMIMLAGKASGVPQEELSLYIGDAQRDD